MAPDPDSLARWIPVYRDFGVVTICLVLLVYEAMFTTPNPLVMTALGTFLAIPVVARVDAKRRQREEAVDDADHEDRWSGLP